MAVSAMNVQEKPCTYEKVGEHVKLSVFELDF